MKCYTHFKLLMYYGMNLSTITHTNPVLTWRRSLRPLWSPLAPTRRWSWEGWAVSLGNKSGPWGRLQCRWPLQQEGTCSAHEPFRRWRWKSKTNTGKMTLDQSTLQLSNSMQHTSPSVVGEIENLHEKFRSALQRLQPTFCLLYECFDTMFIRYKSLVLTDSIVVRISDINVTSSSLHQMHRCIPQVRTSSAVDS